MAWAWNLSSIFFLDKKTTLAMAKGTGWKDTALSAALYLYQKPVEIFWKFKLYLVWDTLVPTTLRIVFI